MNRTHKKRLFVISGIIIALGVATALILYALKQNINLFYTPTQVLQAQINPEQTVRVGGFVKQHSVHYTASGEAVEFIITDKNNEISVDYHGVLPSLFREGQGIVVMGKLNNHQLIASQVLAKHDENYMPWPLAKTLKQGEAQHVT